MNAPVIDEAEPPLKKKRGDKWGVPGIFGNPGKLQARLPGFMFEGKACQKPIPGTYKDLPAVVAAQAEAQQKLKEGGPMAVWPNWGAPNNRNARGTVRSYFDKCTPCSRLPHTVRAGLKARAGAGRGAGQGRAPHVDQGRASLARLEGRREGCGHAARCEGPLRGSAGREQAARRQAAHERAHALVHRGHHQRWHACHWEIDGEAPPEPLLARESGELRLLCTYDSL